MDPAHIDNDSFPPPWAVGGQKYLLAQLVGAAPSLRFSRFLFTEAAGNCEKNSGRFAVISAIDPLKVRDFCGEREIRSL